MMTLNDMKEIRGTLNPQNFGCEFCGKKFARERTIAAHACEYKRRWLERELQGNRLGFQVWQQFYKRNTVNSKVRTYEEFIRSAYYTAFVKFGTYCHETKVINMPKFVDWLITNKVRLDTWNTDTVYTKFLLSYIKLEDAFSAIYRSVEYCAELAANDNIQPNDVFRFGNVNKICYAITTGKISPWVLYQSESGNKFLDKLHPEEVKMVIDYINPEQWAIKFKRDPALAAEIKQVLSDARF